jgi:hypothetical protein
MKWYQKINPFFWIKYYTSLALYVGTYNFIINKINKKGDKN